jgi:radical SAM superfamily enzyme YgiQ (UPF0313 family)
LPDKPFDFVVMGEGEEPLRRIVMGEVVQETTPQLVAGSPVPMEEHHILWDENKYYRTYETLHIWLSRGCPFSCGYCFDRRTTWRAVTPQRAVDELRRVSGIYPQLRSVLITDPLFGVQKPWRDEFLALLRKADLPLAYWVQSRVDVLDRDMIDAVAGMPFRVEMGLESVVPEMLGIMKKTNDPARYLQAFRELDAYMNDRQVAHGINQIVNYPGETNRTLDASLAYWQDHFQQRDDYHSLINVWEFQWYPGCDLWHNDRAAIRLARAATHLVAGARLGRRGHKHLRDRQSRAGGVTATRAPPAGDGNAVRARPLPLQGAADGAHCGPAAGPRPRVHRFLAAHQPPRRLLR